MTPPSDRSTRVSRLIKAPREVVYQAFIDGNAVATWLAPDTMKGHVEVFEPRKGGKIRMSLRYTDLADAPQGKSSDLTDTFEGTFVELIPNEKVVQVVEFESDEPDFAGEMRITWSLTNADGGTEVTVLMEDIPKGVSLKDNELGSRQSLQKLATFVEQGQQQ
jgi:uncharacterized protein YndB with AHSA1/START domain